MWGTAVQRCAPRVFVSFWERLPKFPGTLSREPDVTASAIVCVRFFEQKHV